MDIKFEKCTMICSFSLFSLLIVRKELLSAAIICFEGTIGYVKRPLSMLVVNNGGSSSCCITALGCERHGECLPPISLQGFPHDVSGYAVDNRVVAFRLNIRYVIRGYARLFQSCAAPVPSSCMISGTRPSFFFAYPARPQQGE